MMIVFRAILLCIITLLIIFIVLINRTSQILSSIMLYSVLIIISGWIIKT